LRIYKLIVFILAAVSMKYTQSLPLFLLVFKNSTLCDFVETMRYVYDYFSL